MKNITPIILGVCFLFCTNHLNAQNKNRLEFITQNLESGKIYEELDLSNLNLKNMPDLSRYIIKKLNLSHNKIAEFKYEFLPSHLEKLDISYNEIVSQFNIQKMESCRKFNLKELNASFNRIQSISLGCNLNKLEVNNNDINYLGISDKELNYLDISNNPRLNSIVQFNPTMIKTIKRKNIASEDPLEYALLKQKSNDSFDLKYIKKTDNSK